MDVHRYDPSRLETIEAWGRNKETAGYVFRPSTVDGIRDVISFAQQHATRVVLRGAGRSYGDASLGSEQLILDITRLNRILNWNPGTGVMECEAGVTIEQLWKYCIGDGWWPPVVSGTMAPTLAGALGMNIHGKNNFKVGTIGEHVLELDVITADGQCLKCSPTLLSDLFYAVIGGFGSLGVITRVQVQMKRVYSGKLLVDPIYAKNIDHMFSIFEQRIPDADYLVGWIDAFGSGDSLGRGQVHQANYAKSTNPTQSLRVQAQNLPDNIFGIIPKSILWRLMKPFVNDTGMKLINWAKATASRLKDGVVHEESHAGFAFLLDYVPNWKLAYGAEGLIQYQAFVPASSAKQCFKTILERCQNAGLVPYLAVFKQHRMDPFLMTHAVDGFSLALDFRLTAANRKRVWALAAELDALLLSSGGRFYFAKDATLSSDRIHDYLCEARVQQFLALKRELDPSGIFRTDLFERIFGDAWSRLGGA
jgi:FAD/FMN-containing dehydrogenase